MESLGVEPQIILGDHIPQQKFELFGCAKRGCDTVNPDYLAFGGPRGKSYCLHHVPLRSRLRCWWQEWRGR